MSDAQGLALVSLPLVLATVATAFAWRRVSRPWLFLAASILALLGLQGLAAPAATAVFLYPQGSTSLTTESGFGRALIFSAVLQLVMGIPFMWWLSRGLRKGQS
jgi:hypothetical protein